MNKTHVLLAAVLAALPLAAQAGTDVAVCCCNRPSTHASMALQRPHKTAMTKAAPTVVARQKAGRYVLPAVVRNYYVGPMVDPENPDVRLGACVISRVVESPTWNLTPEPSVANVQGHKIRSDGATLEAARLAALSSQSDSAAKVIQTLCAEVEELKNRLRKDDSTKKENLKAEVRELREQVQQLQQQLTAREQQAMAVSMPKPEESK